MAKRAKKPAKASGKAARPAKASRPAKPEKRRGAATDGARGAARGGPQASWSA